MPAGLRHAADRSGKVALEPRWNGYRGRPVSEGRIDVLQILDDLDPHGSCHVLTRLTIANFNRPAALHHVFDILQRHIRACEARVIATIADPEEFRKRTEQFFRKTLDCMRQATEAQMKEYQDAMNQLSQLTSNAGSSR